MIIGLKLHTKEEGRYICRVKKLITVALLLKFIFSIQQKCIMDKVTSGLRVSGEIQDLHLEACGLPPPPSPAASSMWDAKPAPAMCLLLQRFCVANDGCPSCWAVAVQVSNV